jgi:hypothetical protein
MRIVGTEHLIETETKKETLVDIVTDIKLDELALLDEEWAAATKSIIEDAKARGVDKSVYDMIDWGFKWESMPNSFPPDREIYGLRWGDKLEGMMLLVPAQPCFLLEQSSKLLLKVGELMIAPWNRKKDLGAIGELPVFMGAGKALMRWAIRRSQELGYEGRVGAYPMYPDLIPYYIDTCGMAFVEHPESGRWGEYTPESAHLFLNGG